MATIEQKLAYRKAKEMTAEEARAFVRGIDDDILEDELHRRRVILKNFVRKLSVETILLDEDE